MKEYAWYEVWADDTARAPYILILLFHEEKHSFDIYGPGEKTVRHTCGAYQDAMFWLTADEYTKVDGRMTIV